MNKPLRIGIIGSAGRMGRAIQQEVVEHPEKYKIIYCVERAGTHKIGQMSPTGLPYRHLEQIHDDEAKVWIDFSRVDGLMTNLKWLSQPSIRGAYVLGVTGLREEHSELIREISKIRPVLYSANMSMGIAVIKRIIPLLSQVLGNEAEVEIEETHHKQKEDQPSGTAYMLAHKILEGWDVPKNNRDNHIRLNYDAMHHERQPQTIYCVSHRRGQWVGNHSVHFSLTQEEITLSHKALNRAALALGALDGAAWLQNQPPGLYSMDNVIDERIEKMQQKI